MRRTTRAKQGRAGPASGDAKARRAAGRVLGMAAAALLGAGLVAAAPAPAHAEDDFAPPFPAPHQVLVAGQHFFAAFLHGGDHHGRHHFRHRKHFRHHRGHGPPRFVLKHGHRGHGLRAKHFRGHGRGHHRGHGFRGRHHRHHPGCGH